MVSESKPRWTERGRTRGRDRKIARLREREREIEEERAWMCVFQRKRERKRFISLALELGGKSYTQCMAAIAIDCENRIQRQKRRKEGWCPFTTDWFLAIKYENTAQGGGGRESERREKNLLRQRIPIHWSSFDAGQHQHQHSWEMRSAELALLMRIV